MTPKPLYRRIAAAIGARNNCIATDNDVWLGNWQHALDSMADELPSGSGFDSGTKIDLDESRPNRIVLYTSYHHMDEGGGYDGWTDHRIVITPDFVSDFDIRVGGRNRNDIKEYIADTFDMVLRELGHHDFGNLS